MKIAVVLDRDSRNVINLSGIPNREEIGLQTVRRLADVLKKCGPLVPAPPEVGRLERNTLKPRVPG